MDMSKFVIGIQARSGSTRFPGKVLKSIQRNPIWLTIFYNCAVHTPFKTYMLLPFDDTTMIECAQSYTYPKMIILGPENSPLQRYKNLLRFVESSPVQYVIRLTSDCPLVTSWMILDMAYQMERDNRVFMYNELDGMDVQIAHRSLFEKEIYLDNEHVFNMEKIKEHGLYTKWEMHLSIDTEEQYKHIKFLLEE